MLEFYLASLTIQKHLNYYNSKLCKYHDLFFMKLNISTVILWTYLCCDDNLGS